MKTFRLLVCVVVMSLVGCGVKEEPVPSQTQQSSPTLGVGKIIGEAEMPYGGLLNVVLYDAIDVVCLQPANPKALNCYGIEAAPKGIQSLVAKWKGGVPSYGEQLLPVK